MLPQACILLIQGIVTRHEGQHATGLEDIEGLCQKKSCEGEAATGIHEFEVSEGHVADDSVNAILRQTRIAEVFNADVVSGMQCACDTSGEGVELYTDEPHPRRASAMKLPIPQPGSRTVASWGTPKRLSASCMARMTRGEV